MASVDKHHLVSQGCKSHFLSAIMFRAQHYKAHTVAPNTASLGPKPPRHLFFQLNRTSKNEANDEEQQCKWLYTSHNNVHKSSEFVFDRHPSALNFPLLISLWFRCTNCELLGCSQTSGIGGWHGEALFWVPHFHSLSFSSCICLSICPELLYLHMAPLGMHTLDTSEDLLLVPNEGHTYLTQLTESEIREKQRGRKRELEMAEQGGLWFFFLFRILAYFQRCMGFLYLTLM